MKRFLSLLLLCCAMSAMAQLTVTSLKVNQMEHPDGLTDKHPVFSWIMDGKGRNKAQTAYEIVVYQDGKPIWKTGKVVSDNSITVPYEGKELQSGKRYTWKVRVWDEKGKASRWSEPASWLTGLMDEQEWKARWIEAPVQGDASPLLRKQFKLSKPIASAVAHITARGMYEAAINGVKVGNMEYAPGWTTYDYRLQYQTYDVTSMLQRGENTWGVVLGRGWHHSVLGWQAQSNKTTYKIKNMALLAQLVVTYKDGTQEVIITDDSWKCSTGEILHSTIYDGETIDARLKKEGWSSNGLDDSNWQQVRVVKLPTDDLVSMESEPMVKQELLSPVEVITTPAGEKVLDFGQNLVGREIVTYKGKPGQEIVISHAEVLDEKGNFYTHNLRSAKAQSRYICSGEEDRFEPLFTFYGFRYLKVEGIEEELNPDNFQAVVIHSDMARNGNFTSSNEQVNQLQSNIEWGLKGNFLDVPTDCPQRDERLGWCGDAQVFFRTATFNRQVQNFFGKWLKDLALDQLPDGRVPDVIPNIVGLVGAGRTGWADAATIIPWQHYMAYGDKRILKTQFESMKAWTDFMIGESKEKGYLWDSGWHYGDWLFYSVDNDTAGESAVTYRPLIMQCFFAHSAELTARAARVLGMTEEAAYYEEVTRKAKEAFCHAYLTPAGMLVSATQTAYVLALNFEMLPDEVRPTAARHLAENVKKYGHITTGFLGTPYICHVLTEWGYQELAYQLLLRQQYPGWLYPVTMGATTIWERWNSMMPDRTIPDNGMNSFNHYSYGAIGDWLYRDAVGLRETSPGFKTLAVKPHPGGGFTHMQAEQGTPYGKAAAGWKTTEAGFMLEVTIPVGTTAEIYVPSQSAAQVWLDGKPLSDAKEVVLQGYADGYTQVKVGSGTYLFEARQ